MSGGWEHVPVRFSPTRPVLTSNSRAIGDRRLSGRMIGGGVFIVPKPNVACVGNDHPEVVTHAMGVEGQRRGQAVSLALNGTGPTGPGPATRSSSLADCLGIDHIRAALNWSS